MTDVAIRLEGVAKRYWKLEDQAMLLRSVLPFGRPKRTELWALRDVDLTIERGSVVGMIGHNGAGKTTLLRMMAGVTRPTQGQVTVRGRVAPLISVGVGFHQEMSGRENIYVNGMLLGLTKRQIDERFADIVTFAELEEFVDTPVKFYSSGMYMRLGFAVAVHTDPEVLLVDEILAVGDLAFQMKCYERMREIRDAGTTIVIVSHSIPAIRLLCPRAMVMRSGRLVFDGEPEEAIALHLSLLSKDAQAHDQQSSGQRASAVTLVERELTSPAGETATISAGTPLRFRMRVRFEEPADSPIFHFQIHAQNGTLAYATQNPLLHRYGTYATGDEVEAALDFTARLLGGSYRLSVHVLSNDGSQLLYSDRGMLFFVDLCHRHTKGDPILLNAVG